MSKFNVVGAGVKWGASKVKSIFTGGKQKTTGTEVIKAFKANVPKKEIDKSLRDLKIARAKSKVSTSKLGHTTWQIKTGDWKKKGLKKGFTFDKRPTRTKTSDEKRYEEAQIKKD
jgi:hypothetical protein